MDRLSEKFEKMMIAVSFAEEGLSDEAIQYLEEETQDNSPSSIFNLQGANIWFGTATVED
jgi:hypothetical protein